MARPLPDELKIKIAAEIDEMPFAKDVIIEEGKERGYDMSSFEDPTNTLQDNAAAFMAGIPEGLTYGLMDLGEIGEDAGSVDAPLLGEVQPSRELGRLLGGVVSGGALWKSGTRIGIPAGKKVLDALVGRGLDPKKKLAKGMQKATEISVNAMPEAVVGSLAQTYRANDLGELDNSFAEWMALGIGSEVLVRKVMGWMLKRKTQGNSEALAAEGNALREEVKAESENQINLRKNTDGEVESPIEPYRQQESLADMDEFHASAPPPEEMITPSLTKKEQAREITSMNGETVKRHAEASGGYNPVLPDDNILNYKTDWQYKGPGGVTIKKSDLIPLNLSESDGTKQLGRIYYNNKAKLDDGVVARLDADDRLGSVIQMDLDNLKSLWNDSERYGLYRKGIKGLPKFDSIDEFRKFILLHEVSHKKFPLDKWKEWYVKDSKAYEKLKEAAEQAGVDTADMDLKFTSNESYEDWINGQALKMYQDMGDVPLVRDQLPTENAFSNNVDKKLSLVDVKLRPATSFSMSDHGLNASVTSPSGKMTIEGHIVDTAEDGVLIHNDKTGKERWVTVSRGWDIRVAGRPAVESVSGPEFPFQSGGSNAAPDHMRQELASLLSAVRKADSKGELTDLAFIPESITIKQAQDLIDDLKGIRSRIGVVNRSRDIDDIERVYAGSSYKAEEPPLPEYFQPIPEDVQRKARGPLHTLLRKFWVPTSRRIGFGAHPATAQAIRNTVRFTVEKQGLEEGFTQPLEAIEAMVMGVDPGANVIQKATGAASRAVKGVDNQQKMYQFFNLVEDVNGGVPFPTALESYPLLRSNPKIKEAFQAHNRLTNDIADRLGLGKNKRIRYYVPHIFADRSGEYAAASVMNQLDPDTALKLKSLVDDIGTSSIPDTPESPSRGFRHLRKRDANLDGFESDYSQIMRIYIRGASAKLTNDKIARHHHSAIMKLISEGNQDIAEDLAKYARYAMGLPTNFREKVAHVFSDSHLFNSSVDRLMGFIGGRDAEILTRARENPHNSEIVGEARQWLRELDDIVRLRDRVTGQKKTKQETLAIKTIRSKLAKRMDMIREGLNNPYATATTSNFIYRTQIISKLGFNIAHGMINQTQTLTNTLPMLKTKNVAWGYTHSLFNAAEDKVFNGRTIKDIIDESGISKDVSRQEEFLDGFKGVLTKVQDMSMLFARHSERVNRQTALLGGYKQYVEEGASHLTAMNKARELVERTQFPFNRAGTSPILRSPVARLFLMFKSYPMHQTDFTFDLVAQALTKGPDGKPSWDNIEPLFKHVLAYMALIGGGSYMLPDTNFGERTMPPMADIPMDIAGDSGRYGFPGSVAKNAMGPFGDTMTKIAGGLTALIDGGTEQAMDKAIQAVNAFAVPATVRRLYGDEIDVEDLLKGKKYDWLWFTGLKKYDPNKGERVKGAINPLQSLGVIPPMR